MLTPNDDTASAVTSYLKTLNTPPRTFPTTGQDATSSGLQNILAGYQCGTVYKPIYAEAQAAAALALYLRAGVAPPASLVSARTYDPQDHVEVPSVLLKPVWVTASNMAATVVRDGRAGVPVVRGRAAGRLPPRRDPGAVTQIEVSRVSPAASQRHRPARLPRRPRRRGERRAVRVIGLAVIGAIFQSLNSHFLAPVNLTKLLVQGAVFMLLGMGEVFALLLGDIDLSIGFVSGLGGVVAAELLAGRGTGPGGRRSRRRSP